MLRTIVLIYDESREVKKAELEGILGVAFVRPQGKNQNPMATYAGFKLELMELLGSGSRLVVKLEEAEPERVESLIKVLIRKSIV